MKKKWILGPTRGRSFIYMVLFSFFHKSLSLFSLSLFLWIPLYKDLHFPFIFTHKLSSSYTWRVEIAFQDFCPIQNVQVSFCLAIWVVPPLFMVISSLMRPKEDLLYIWFCFPFFTNLSLFSLFLSFSGSPFIRIFIFHLYLHTNYLHPTLGGLRSFQDFCPI